MYNLTNLYNSKSLFDVYIAVDSSINNYLSLFILIMIFVITYFGISSPTISRKMLGASLITTFLGSLLFFNNLIPVYYLTIFPILFLITIVYEAFS